MDDKRIGWMNWTRLSNLKSDDGGGGGWQLWKKKREQNLDPGDCGEE
jgi:hypothetical protein